MPVHDQVCLLTNPQDPLNHYLLRIRTSRSFITHLIDEWSLSTRLIPFSRTHYSVFEICLDPFLASHLVTHTRVINARVLTYRIFDVGTPNTRISLSRRQLPQQPKLPKLSRRIPMILRYLLCCNQYTLTCFSLDWDRANAPWLLIKNNLFFLSNLIL